jgi:single stranded DNA-binding protein
MIGINNVTIIGNVGTVGEVMTNTNGTKFVNLLVATTESFTTMTKEKKTNTQWHNVVLWNTMTELQKMLSKGDLLFVEGRLNYRKKSPSQIFTEIVAKNIRILNKKNHHNSEIKVDLDDIIDEDFNSEIEI